MLHANFIELFRAICKSMDQDDHVIRLSTVLVELCDANITREIVVVFLLHGFHTSDGLLKRGNRIWLRCKHALKTVSLLVRSLVYLHELLTQGVQFVYSV